MQADENKIMQEHVIFLCLYFNMNLGFYLK